MEVQDDEWGHESTPACSTEALCNVESVVKNARMQVTIQILVLLMCCYCLERTGGVLTNENRVVAKRDTVRKSPSQGSKLAKSLVFNLRTRTGKKRRNKTLIPKKYRGSPHQRAVWKRPAKQLQDIYPLWCNCEELRNSHGAKCYSYTRGDACATRSCRSSFVCTSRSTGILCMRRLMTEKVVPLGDGRCTTLPYDRFVYTPYFSKVRSMAYKVSPEPTPVPLLEQEIVIQSFVKQRNKAATLRMMRRSLAKKEIVREQFPPWCNCKVVPPSPKSRCFSFIPQTVNGACTERPCKASYECVGVRFNSGMLCLRKWRREKIVRAVTGSCSRVPDNRFVYVPYNLS